VELLDALLFDRHDEFIGEALGGHVQHVALPLPRAGGDRLEKMGLTLPRASVDVEWVEGAERVLRGFDSGRECESVARAHYEVIECEAACAVVLGAGR
jgi:hypothetical protein